jgi:hypothetical protein
MSHQGVSLTLATFLEREGQSALLVFFEIFVVDGQ